MRSGKTKGFRFFSSDPNNCPFFLITRTALSATTFFRDGFAEAGLTSLRPAYMGVLLTLWNEDGLKVTELGRRAGLEPSTMTGLLDRMERDALVQRVFDPGNRRELKVCLTDAGRAVKDEAAAAADRILQRMLNGLSEAEVAQLKDTLRNVLANVREEGDGQEEE